MTAHRSDIRLSADVGGTFTDMVLEAGESRWTAKVLTTPARPEEGVRNGITQVLSLAGIGIGDVAAFVHGTTLATNAIIERRGARTALIGTDGFRDILEIGTESRYDQYELALVRPAPLVPRPLRFTVPERIGARGEILLPLAEEAVRGVAGDLREAGVESVAVCLLHAYANPRHELAIRDILAEALPGVAVSLSHEVSPEIREYERTSTTVANAYVQPVISGYLRRLERALRQDGFAGFFSIMTSGGGLTPVESALRFPVRLVESGPAGGAIFASRIAATLDERKVIAFDMGGTTAKICLIRDFQPETARTFEVDRAARFMKGSGLPVRIPVIELVEIGAGGGSVAGVDELRRIRVGPESASSDPGPACYGLGGQAPTVTDADLTLGLIEPELFAGGTIRLLPGLSRLALEGGVGEALGLDADMAAHGIYEMVCENMASAARTHAVERGASTDQFTIIASGGAAPLHVARVAEKIGAGRVIVPPNAGVGSAVGFLAAPISYEIVRTGYLRLDAFDPHAANALLGGATEEIGSWLRKATDAPLVERRLAFMRYLGQGHEIPVDLPEGDLDDDSAAILRASFETTYRDLFRRTVPGAEIEVMAWSVRISTESRLPAAVPGIVRKKPATPFSVRQVYDGQMRRSTPVPFFRRTDLEPGDVLRGPAVVCERETSTFVSGAFDAVIDATGSIVMDRKPKEIAA